MTFQGQVFQIAQRHGLPVDLARQVVKGYLKIDDALRQRGTRPRRNGARKPAESKVESRVRVQPVRRERQSRKRSSIRTTLMVAALFLAGSAMSYYGWTRWQEQVERSARIGAAAEAAEEAVDAEAAAATGAEKTPAQTAMKTDELGRLVEVAGPDPRTVLIEFCRRSGFAGQLEPLELASAVPAEPGLRVGVFRDHQDAGRMLAIEIRKNQASRWVAGDGEAPVQTIEAGEIVLGEPRIPLESS